MVRAWLSGLHKPSVAYAATSLSASMMSSVFGFYYVKVYLNRFHVSEWWFQFAQIIFMVWNAVNDPLFGYLQDNMNYSWVKSRRHCILYGAPLFALSFLLTWIPWADYTKDSWLNGIQLLFVLCFWDSLFTFVLLAQCALFAEMSKQPEDRLRLVKYSQIGSLIGCTSVMFCNFVSNNLENYVAFVIACAVISFLSWAGMHYSGKNAFTEYDLQLLSKGTPSSRENTSDELSLDKSSDYSWFQQTIQIISQPNFIYFVLMNFCQIFHTTYLSNFTGIISDQLIPTGMIPDEVRSAFYGLLYVLPQLMVIFGSPLIGHIGYYYAIRASFIMKIVLGLTLYFVGPERFIYIMLFFLLDSAASHATFSLFNLSLSDIIDQDITKYQRKHPLSSMVFGTNALITKPAISFAPMIAVAILNRHGYEKVKTTTAVPSVVTADLNSTMFNLTCVIPVIIGILQLLIWSRYTIRNSHSTVQKYVET